MGDMDDAVDRAVSTLAGSGQPGSAEPATPAPSPSSSATATPAAAPATGTGFVPASDATGKAAPAATTPADDDGAILQSADWLDLEKRKGILNGARTKASEAARLAVLRDLGLRADQIEQLRPHLSLMLTDIGEYHRQLTESLTRRGLLQAPSRAVADPPASATPPQPPRQAPQPDLVFSDGRKAYSADAAAELVDWVAEGLRAEFGQLLDEKLTPLQQTDAELRAERTRLKAHEIAADVMAEASSWAYFDEFREQIADLMAGDKRVTVHSAYNRLLQEKLKTEPAKLKEQTRLATLKEIRDTPTGSPSIVPGQAPVAARKTGKSLDDVFEQAVNRAFATVGSTPQ